MYPQDYFDPDSLLTTDSLLFHPITSESVEPTGMAVRNMPTTMQRDNIMGAVLVAGLLLLLLIVGQGKHIFRTATSQFFFPTNNTQSLPTQENGLSAMIRFAIHVLLVLGLTIVCYLYISYQIDVESLLITPYELFLLYLLIVLVFLLCKSILYRLVHWTFFSRPQCQSWRRHAFYLFSCEGLLIFPLVTMLVFLNSELEWLGFSLIFVLLFVKILLTFKVRSIFFPRIGGSFHLFAYLCALEIAPYLVLWAFLMAITNQMVPQILVP